MSAHLKTFIFFFNDTATTEIYTLSLHDALPIFRASRSLISMRGWRASAPAATMRCASGASPDRKSTRLNSSHQIISYAVFCLKKKKQRQQFVILLLCLTLPLALEPNYLRLFRHL